MKLILSAAPMAVPLPLEPYFEYHFTKVGDQTRFMIRRYIEEGRARDLPVDKLEELRTHLPSPDSDLVPSA